AVPGGAANVADVYPLAPLQEGIFFHHLMADHEGDDAYVLPTVLEFDSRDRLDEFVGALRWVVDRHDVYRTAIMWEGLREPVQVVARRAELDVVEVELDDEADPVGQLRGAAGGRLELDRAPLMSVHVAAEPAGDGHWLALLRIHHLVQDHTALEVLLDELRAFLSGRADDLPEPLPFRQFVAQARLGASQEEHQRYFAELLGDVTEPTAPFGLTDVLGDGGGSRRGRLPLDTELALSVREMARTLGTSPATVFHLAWGRVLAAVSERDDVVFGTVLFGRMNAGAGADRVPGLFLNTLPVRVRTTGIGVGEALDGMRRQLADLLVHEHAPLTVAQTASGVAGGSPLFTSIFNYRHARPAGDRSGAGLDGASVVLTHEGTNYPLSTSVDDDGTGFTITVDAPPPIPPHQVCELLHTALAQLATVLADTPQTPLAAAEVLPPAEARRILGELSGTVVPVPDATPPELFAAQAERTPDAIALVRGAEEVTYRELRDQVGQLARALSDRGAGPEAAVAVNLDDEADRVVALLAVLESGAAHLAVEHPISDLRADARPVCLLTSEMHALDLPDDTGIPLVLLNTLGTADEWIPADAPVGVAVLPDHPAYVDHTLVVSHRGFATRLAGMRRAHPLTGADRVAPTTDAWAYDVLRALVDGAALVLGRTGKEPAQAGLPVELVGLLYETTDDETSPAPHWHPADNTRLCILDGALRVVPAGAAGDLYVSGEGLALGYAGRAGLTAERFVACPYGVAGERMYRTGERARWTDHGRLELLERHGDEPTSAEVDSTEHLGRTPATPQEELLCAEFARVLGVARVGVDDNYFLLGGQSLMATRLVARLRSILGVELPVRALFENPTPAGLAARLAQAAPGRARLTARERPERVPLSFGQHRLWFMSQLEGSSAGYSNTTALRLSGTLDRAALKATLHDLVNRHEVLRTVLPAHDGEPYQRVLAMADVELELPVIEVGAGQLAPETARVTDHPFDLATEIPLRAWLFAEAPREHVLVLAIHHGATDGWSMGPLARDLSTAYEARCAGRAPEWQPLPVQYADYALWQRELLSGDADSGGLPTEQMDFWRDTLAGIPEEIPLPAERPRVAAATHRAGEVPVEIGAELHHRMRELAATEGATLFMVVQAALAALLTRLGSGEDIPIGTAIAGRVDDTLDDLVGFFVNMLVLRTDVSGDPSFQELLARVRAADLAAYAHQDLPFDHVVEQLTPERSAARQPLFRVALVVQNTPRSELRLPGLRVSAEPVVTGSARSDLMLTLSERLDDDGTPNGLRGLLQFDTDVLDRPTADRLMTWLARLLDTFVTDPGLRLSHTDVLTPPERRTALERGAGPAVDVPASTVPELFGGVVERSVGAPAVVWGEGVLSY
ncbi:condensation domain-containing protein, partial [Streptomyces canus]|uniref:condensation domain-containing protein n=1 Tax=Streptomyces canus TaxID=58343 RepID=UPI0033FF7388